MSYKSNESKRRFKRNLKRAKLKAIKNKDAIVTAVAATVILGGLGGLVYRLSTEEKPNIYMGEMVQYDGEDYWLSNLYVLSYGDETHLCNLEHREKQFYTLQKECESGSTIRSSKKIIYDPWVYVDVKTKDELSIRHYEDSFKYEVTPVTDKMTFDESDGTLVYDDRIRYNVYEMSEEQYETLVNNDGKAKSLVYMNNKKSG